MSVSIWTTRSLSLLTPLAPLALLPLAACGPASASGASTAALPTVPPAAAAPGDTLYFAQLIVAGTAAEWDSRPGFVIGSAPLRPLL